MQKMAGGESFGVWEWEGFVDKLTDVDVEGHGHGEISWFQFFEPAGHFRYCTVQLGVVQYN